MTKLPIIPDSDKAAVSADPWNLPRGGQLSDETRKDQSRAAQRQRILFGMRRCCVEYGYATTSVARVLEIAKVSRKTFYEQFDSKEDCFLALYQLVHEGLFEFMIDQASQYVGWEQQVRGGYRAYLQFFLNEPDFAAVVAESRAAAGPAAVKMHASGRRRFARLFEEFYKQRRIEVPDLPAAPKDLFLVIISGVDSLLADRVRTKDLEFQTLEPAIGALLEVIFAIPSTLPSE